MAISCASAIVTEAFPEKERGMGLGFLAVSVSAGLITGPVLGGFLLGWLDWRSIYYVRIPFGLMVLVMALLFLNKDKVQQRKIRFDLLGMLTSSAGLACLMVGINQLNRFGLKSSMFLLTMGLGLLSFMLFILIERRVSDPIVDLSLFKNRVFSSALCGLFTIFLTYSAYILLMPFYLLQAIGMRPSKAGVIMTIVSMTAIIVGPVSGWLSDRFGQVWFATLGALITVTSFWLIGGFDLESRVIDIFPALMLAGLGMGMFQSPNSSSIMGSVRKDRLGTASAMIAMFRQVGISLGMALAGTIYAARMIHHAAELNRAGIQEALANKQAIAHSFSDVFFVSAIAMTLAVALSAATWQARKPQNNLVCKTSPEGTQKT